MNLFWPQTGPGSLSGLRKWADAFLRKLGPSWRAAPLRRVIQLLCLAVFAALLFHAANALGPDFSSTLLAEREWLPVETFLWLDPLVGVSGAMAARAWTVALYGAAGVFVVCVIFPRGFCGYVCPLGTVIDGFDWLMGRRFQRARPAGWRVHLRFCLLAAVLAAAGAGVLLAGYVSAMAVLTRGLGFSGGRLQMAILRGWDQVPPAGWGVYGAIGVLSIVLLLGLLGRRFWCNTLCPTGALCSCFSLARVQERRVRQTCTGCGRCREACAFEAIRADITTRRLACTFCQVCGGVCPVRAIEFVPRRRPVGARPTGLRRAPSSRDLPMGRRPLPRRALVLSALGGLAAGAGIRFGAGGWGAARKLLRPPGAVEEGRFLDLCVRCGQCMKVCPGPVLHPAGLEGGVEALWTPVAVPSIAPCHQDCNFCTQVCPTGAIRPLRLAEKRRTSMGLAVVDRGTCLAHSGQQDCSVCFEACEAAEYHAIEMRQIRLEVGDIPEGAVSAMELEEMSRIDAPFVKPEACVGCGQCEYRCLRVNVEREKLLRDSAIAVTPGSPARR